MSKAQLAGLVGALVAYAGGSGSLAAATPGGATTPPAAARAHEIHSDLDLATLKSAEARPGPKNLAAPAGALASQSDASGVNTDLNSRYVQPIGRPSPTSWLLLVIGVGMIGGALRGFIVANRALARLQPEERD